MKILVSGLFNLENSTNVHSFPIDYQPITYAFNEVNFCVSGVGYNITKALRTLGDDAIPLTLLGEDDIGDYIISNLVWHNIPKMYCYQELEHTCTSTVLYDDSGARRIYCDLKDIQEQSIEEPDEEFDGYVLTNINFNASLIEKYRKEGKLIFTDVHAISDVNDEYNARFMKNADVLFMSDEKIIDKVSFIKEVKAKYQNKIIVMGCGAEGSLILLDEGLYKIDALKMKNVTNTVGAGDALFSAFVHFYLKGNEPLECIKLATLFATYKISKSGGAEGFLGEKELLSLFEKFKDTLTTYAL